MTVVELLAVVLVALVVAFNHWHHWLLIRRQHVQIRELERIIALRQGPEAVASFIAEAQKQEAPVQAEETGELEQVS
jgi:hypothetical protein